MPVPVRLRARRRGRRRGRSSSRVGRHAARVYGPHAGAGRAAGAHDATRIETVVRLSRAAGVLRRDPDRSRCPAPPLPHLERGRVRAVRALVAVTVTAARPGWLERDGRLGASGSSVVNVTLQRLAGPHPRRGRRHGERARPHGRGQDDRAQGRGDRQPRLVAALRRERPAREAAVPRPPAVARVLRLARPDGPDQRPGGVVQAAATSSRRARAAR